MRKKVRKENNSTMELEQEKELAIKARGVVKGYGSSLVLKGLDMDVPYGSM